VFWPGGWTNGSPAGGLDVLSLAIGLAAAVALFRFKANVILVIMVCGAAGLVTALTLR
jgi:chromate transporter